MNWIRENLPTGAFERARLDADSILLKSSLGQSHVADEANLRFIAEALELAVDEVLSSDVAEVDLRTTAADAFRLGRALSRSADPIRAATELFRLACLAQLGDLGADITRLLRENPLPEPQFDSLDWAKRVLSVVIDSWLRLYRKQGWDDLTQAQEGILRLRRDQQQFERTYLETVNQPRKAAWKLVCLYHFSKASEILVIYLTQGEVQGDFMVKNLLDAQFDRAIGAAQSGNEIELEALVRLGAAAARQMADNSIWSVTRAVNSRVTKFVKELVNRPHQSIFEVLPPQRKTLAEQGLLGSSRRSVVVSLPTSSGKTLIAEFRILQALNQFDTEQGWIAYLAPTRALVCQITRKLRRDFRALEVAVEMANPALEIDSLEAEIFLESNPHLQFRVLVTTPEKLDLLLRGGWESRIGRPLTLVVVDEAHNLGEPNRGLRLELLLATINRECKHAQFLLLTPFIQNARDIAAWLDERNCQDISLALDWQPNDRAVGLIQPQRIGSNKTEFEVNFETRHTNRHTLNLPDVLPLPHRSLLCLDWKNVVGSPNKLAAVAAQSLQSRGSVILLAARPDYCWNIANLLRIPDNLIEKPSPDIQLVQKFLEQEFAPDFPLIDLLNYGVAVHHRGLSDEALRLIEWLFEKGDVRILVATTTIAQGMNFPVAGVVMASHQYFGRGYAQDMPAEDFWNVAGRAGRVDQGSVGIVALAANTDAKAHILREFIDAKVKALNSTLVALVEEAMSKWPTLDLASLLFKEPKWSCFLQYLAHSYRQMESGQDYANRIEQILRGTLGFNSLRQQNRGWADQLIQRVRIYALNLAGGPLALIDQTGFSLESVKLAMGDLRNMQLGPDVWDGERLFSKSNENLSQMIGVLLRVPELREGFSALLSGNIKDGRAIASFVMDWVNGASLDKLATDYFLSGSKSDADKRRNAFQECCRQLYGPLAQTVSWGLSALQSISLAGRADSLSEEQLASMRNLPAWVYYGVNSDRALALRMIGVPRQAAIHLATAMKTPKMTLPTLRSHLLDPSTGVWKHALGDREAIYFKVWCQLES